MSADKKGRDGRRLLSLFQRAEKLLEVSGYHSGDVRSDSQVAILASATLIGDVISPAVTVSGSIHGSVVAETLTITDSGQVWGDVFCTQLTVQPGGRLYGWFTNLDAEEYLSIQASWEVPLSADVPEESSLPDNPQQRSATEREAMRRLRSRAADALAARAKLEEILDERVKEIAGEAITRVASLEDDLAALSEKLRQSEEGRDELRQEVERVMAASQSLADELNKTRKAQDENLQKLAALQEERERQDDAYSELVTAKKDIEALLLESRREAESLQERLIGLEAALQASLEDEDEQEQSMLRWRNVADATQAEVNRLETELAELNGRLHRAENKRRQAEQALAESQEQQADKALEAAALSKANEKIVNLEDELSAEKSRAGRMATALQEAKNENELLAEKLRWHNANQRILLAELEQSKRHSKPLHELVAQLQTELAAKEQALVGRIEENARLEESLQQTQMRLQASQGEIEAQLREIEFQGQRLANAQATLIERELQLQEQKTNAHAEHERLTQRLKEQRDLIRRMRKVSSDHIESLETQLARVKELLKQHP